MEITEVRIKVLNKEDSSVKAVASINLNGMFVVHNIRVIEGKSGLFIAFPASKGNDGKFRDIAHPINSDFRKQIETAVLDKYNEEVA